MKATQDSALYVIFFQDSPPNTMSSVAIFPVHKNEFGAVFFILTDPNIT